MNVVMGDVTLRNGGYAGVWRYTGMGDGGLMVLTATFNSLKLIIPFQ
jgi:hypothetical protein